MSFWYLYDGLSLLLLVFIGFFFLMQVWRAQFPVLLGFLLPTVIFGRYGVWNESDSLLSGEPGGSGLPSLRAVLVAPIWLVRAASRPGRQRVAAIPVAIAILCQVSIKYY